MDTAKKITHNEIPPPLQPKISAKQTKQQQQKTTKNYWHVVSCWLNCFDIAVQIEYWKYCVLNYKTHLPPDPEELLKRIRCNCKQDVAIVSDMALPVPFVVVNVVELVALILPLVRCWTMTALLFMNFKTFTELQNFWIKRYYSLINQFWR